MPNIKKGESAALSNTNVTEFIPIQSIRNRTDINPELSTLTEIIIRTDPANTGTIKFAVGELGSSLNLSSQYAYPADKIIYLTLFANQSFFAQASAATQSFSCEY